MEVVITLFSVFLVSLISLIGVVALSVRKKLMNRLLLVLVSLSAGTLFGGAILHLLPEAIETNGYSLYIGLLVLAGIITFFIVEKFVHYHSSCSLPHAHRYPTLHENHKHHIGVMNIFGDGLHNFADGLIIAASYMISLPVGIAATVAVILHEIPQELADFGVLVYSGFSVKKAILWNFLSASIAILGAITGLVLGNYSETFLRLIIPFAAGGFIYVAGSNLLPELHRECRIKESVIHLLSIFFGIGIMVLLLFINVGH